MARAIGRLTALKVNRLSQPSMHADGGGLYLQVTRTAAKSWIYQRTLRDEQGNAYSAARELKRANRGIIVEIRDRSTAQKQIMLEDGWMS